MPPKKVSRGAHRLNASRSSTLDQSIASLKVAEDPYSHAPTLTAMPRSAGNNAGRMASTVQKATHTTPSINRGPTIKLPASSPVTPAEPEEEFCHYCCDLVRHPYRHECVDCGAIVCEQSKPRNSGCLLHQSLRDSKGKFVCPLCYQKKKGVQLPYVFVGYSMRNQVKMLWPLCVINISLESMKDKFIGETVRLDMESHYDAAKSRMLTASLLMRKAAQVAEVKKLSPATSFLDRSVDDGMPANTFVLLDTHSDELTGCLQHCGGLTNPAHTKVGELLTSYLGEKLMAGMSRCSKVAKQDDAIKFKLSGAQPWCEITTKSRGGHRGVFLVTCGPAIRQPYHFDEVQKLVSNDIFDFVIGFGGAGTLPTMVASAVRGFLLQCAVYGSSDLWASMCSMLTSNNELLDHTTLVMVYAVEVNGERRVESRQIAKHSLPFRPFGHEFRACGTSGCQPKAYDFTARTKKNAVHLVCTKCGWQSGKIRFDANNDHFKQLSPIKAPLLFWHHFPPSAALQNLFVSHGKSRLTSVVQGNGAGTGGGDTGKDKRAGKRRRVSSSDLWDEDAMDLS
ncbi:hypothetical protein M405DRAFT_847007 [Rhizopogon salebrosus TDB-379]|nr:hypothetical protein M405DRAFT_847007 [Rhizopogon salebrosus TDB-379]